MTKPEIEALLRSAGLSGVTLGELPGMKAIFVSLDKGGKQKEFLIGSVAFKQGGLILNPKDYLTFILAFSQDENEWHLIELFTKERVPGAVILPGT